MSHFSVLVIGEDPESQLERYDENLELPMHQVATKEELVKKERAWIKAYRDCTYAEFLADPEKYKAQCNNEAHIKYLEEEFPKMLEWTDEQCYQHRIRDYVEAMENGEGWCEVHEDGSLWKTSNEAAKWDWYQIGGRWRGKLKLKQPNQDRPLHSGYPFDNDNDFDRMVREGLCDQALVGEVSNLNEIVTFAVVKDGVWYEKGEMGWWCAVSNEKTEGEWKEEIGKLLADLPEDTLLTIVDCHI